MTDVNNLYRLDGRVPIAKAIPFGLQHVLAMFVSNIAPIIILANIVGTDASISAALIQNCMIIAGIGTLVQLYPIWRIGSRLPIVMGISFTFLSLSIVIATSQGMGSLMGAVVIGGIVERLLGIFAKYWIRIITPIVAATVVTAIGFSLLPIGANSFAGGLGAADFGAAHNWIVGSVTLLTCLLCQVFAKGPLRSLSILVGLVVGYALAAIMGMVDFSRLHDVSVVSWPMLLPFKLEFNIGAILSVIAIYMVSATETIGDVSALCSGVLQRQPRLRELSTAITCDGFLSSVAGLFGCTPITSFSQNVGLANLSGVINRFTIATGACIMLLGGIFPIVGTLLTTIPQAVLGGCTVIMFGSIMFAGFGMLAKCGFNDRNMIIISLSLSIGLGFTQASGLFAIFPPIFQTIFAENCVALVFALAVILDLTLPKIKK
ncbi:MAG: purine permease [Bacteroidales bacterium]|nr:purine permease [Bacteroidales bacterium]